jgi:hypothetical protein
VENGTKKLKKYVKNKGSARAVRRSQAQEEAAGDTWPRAPSPAEREGALQRDDFSRESGFSF